MKKSNYTTILLVVVVVLGLLLVLNWNSDKPFWKRVDNATEELGDGIKDAGRELEPNRTPGEKIGDAVKDLGDDIKDSTD